MQRLRLYGKLVGYRRLEQNNWFYSIDEFWWNGKPIEFDRIDHTANYFDKNKKRLYQNDVILISNKDESFFVYLIFSEGKCLGQKVETEELIELTNYSLEFKAISSGNKNLDRLLLQHISNTKGLRDQLQVIS